MEEKEQAYVYVRKVPFKVENEDIFPMIRREYIDTCTNEKIKNHRFYVWKLLEKAIKDIFNTDIKDVSFVFDSGRWDTRQFYFSLSHSDDLVGVAISMSPIGLDLENTKNLKVNDELRNRILTERENQRGDMVDLCEAWTKKEAIYKEIGTGRFAPSKIDYNYLPTRTITLEANNNTYKLSVTSTNVRFNFGKDVHIIY